VALKWQTSRLDAAQQEVATVKAEYTVFKEGVRKAGEEQLARNKETVAKQEKINARAIQTLNSRYSDLDARYQRLRESAGIGAGSRPMPAVPDTARPVDDLARDSRLLEVLRAADQQTATLIELQGWVRQQSKP